MTDLQNIYWAEHNVAQCIPWRRVIMPSKPVCKQTTIKYVFYVHKFSSSKSWHDYSTIVFVTIYDVDLCNQYEYLRYKPSPYDCGAFCQCAPLITGAHHVPGSHGVHGGQAFESYQVYSWVKHYCPSDTKWSQKLKNLRAWWQRSVL